MGPARLTDTRRPLVAASLAACLVMSSVVPALAAPAVSTPQIRAKQAEYQQAQGRLADLADAAEQRVEQYNAAVDALAKTRAAIDQNEAELIAATEALDRATKRLSDRADSIYRSGTVGPLELFLGANSVEDFLARMDLLAAIGQQDADLLGSVRDARFRVTTARAALDAREAEQVSLRAQADERRKQVQDAYSAQHEYVASLSANIQKLIAAEQERQRKLAEERARVLALAQARAAELAKENTGGTGGTGGGGGHSSGPLPTGQGVSDVVGIAMKYLGVAYVWGGESPDGFDCSGLSQFCYARCGISIPRTAAEQFNAGQRIPADRVDLLQPGDLVFFGYHGDPGQVHHVGIYCGSGDFIHAPASGDHVRVSSLQDRIDTRHDYVGASRF